MNKNKIIGIIATLIILVAFVARLRTNKKNAEDKIYHYDKSQPVSVQIDTIKLTNIIAESKYTGTFEPYKETKISAEISGKISKFYVDNGSIIKNGDKLLKIDELLLREQLNIIETQIANINAEFELQLQANQIQIDGITADVDRYTVLSKADAIQGVQLEKALIQLKTAQNQRKIILQQSSLKNAEAQRAQVLQQIHKTTIKAPFNGIVTSKLTEEGAYAAPGVPLIYLTDISQLKFTVNASENELKHFIQNQKYDISIDVYPELNMEGKVIMIGSKSNMGSSFPVQLLVSNTSDMKIKSGMFGKVIISNPNPEKGIIIPSSALVGTTLQKQVYVVKNGKAHLQNVTIGKKIKNNTLVSEGLSEGDIIVTGGFINLFDEANVIFN